MLNMHIASLSWSFFLKTKLFHINVVYCEPKIISIHIASRNVQKLPSWAPHNHIQKNMKYSGVFLCFSLPQPLPGLAQSEGRHPTPSSSFKTERKGLNWLAPLWLVWSRPEGLVCLLAQSTDRAVAWHGGKSGALKGVAPADTRDSGRILQTCRHLGKRWEAEGHNRNGTLMALRRSQGKTDKPQHLEGAMYTTGLGGTKRASPGKMNAQKMPEMTWSLYWADSWWSSPARSQFSDLLGGRAVFSNVPLSTEDHKAFK